MSTNSKIQLKAPSPIRGRKVRARYGEPEDPEFRGNPLIEALPKMWDWEEEEPEIIHKLSHHIPVDESLRNSSGVLRKNYLAKFKTRFFQVFKNHQQLEENFSVLIRNGYSYRNPLSLRFRRELHDKVDELLDSSDEELPPIIPAGNLGFTLLGSPGMGKTLTLSKILQLYPQVIEHVGHPMDPEFRHTQLAWLFLTCPHDSSSKGLCKEFFNEVDAIIGTDYRGDYRRETEDGMIGAMATVAGLHSLGALVVDEIQFLKGGNADLLKFLVQFQNSMGVPIIFVGTHAAASLVAGSPHQARRSVGLGGASWEPLTLDCVEWDLLINSMWEHQVLRNFVPLNDELARVVYDECQGIVSFAVDVFYFAQIDAIDNGTERLSEESLRRAARDHMKFIRPYVKALKSRNPVAMRLLEDIVAANFEDYYEFARKALLLPKADDDELSASYGGPGNANCGQTYPSPDVAETPTELATSSKSVPSLQAPPPTEPVIAHAQPPPKKRRRGQRIVHPEGTLMAFCDKIKDSPEITPLEVLDAAGFIRMATEWLPKTAASA